MISAQHSVVCWERDGIHYFMFSVLSKLQDLNAFRWLRNLYDNTVFSLGFPDVEHFLID